MALVSASHPPEATVSDARIQTFREFYPYYLSEHRNGACRVCHFLGSSLVLTLLGYGIATSTWWLGILMPGAGYGPAWIGHYVFEKNRPATFTYPAWSLLADWVMMKDIVIGRVPLFGELPAPTD
jgi:hypothetical protein